MDFKNKLKSKVNPARRDTPSLKTTVPQGIVSFLELAPGDELYWKMDFDGSKKTVIVTSLSNLKNNQSDKTSDIQTLTPTTSLGGEFSVAQDYSDLGNVYFNQGNLKEALKNYNKALDKYRELEYTKGEADVLAKIGNTHMKLGDQQQALVNLQKALELHTKLQQTEQTQNNKIYKTTRNQKPEKSSSANLSRGSESAIQN